VRERRLAHTSQTLLHAKAGGHAVTPRADLRQRAERARLCQTTQAISSADAACPRNPIDSRPKP
jgi:hypothetical protein